MDQKTVKRIGWFASAMGICMFVSFLDQIRLNLSGVGGSVVLPAATVVNCISWSAYGYLKSNRDWPLICSNGLGTVVAFVAFLTAIAARG
jgi:uncharacterized protein with PQ loop repeat